MAITPGAPGNASVSQRGLMTAAHYSKLDALMSEAALEAALATIPTTTAALPDSTNRRYVTDAQSAALHPAVTVSSPAGWLTLSTQALTFALVAAGAAVDGVVNQLAQTWTGIKTFASAVVMSAGLTISSATNPTLRVSPPAAGAGGFATPAVWFETTASNQTTFLQFGSGLTSTTWELAIGIYNGAGGPIISSRAGPIFFNLASGQGLNPISPGANDLGSTGNYWRNIYAQSVAGANGTGSTDRCFVAGTTVADGSVHASAKIAVVATGIAGTQVDKLWVTKDGTIRQVAGAAYRGSSTSSGALVVDDSIGSQLTYGVANLYLDSGQLRFYNSSTGTRARVDMSTGDVTSVGDLESTVVGKGFILKSPDGTRYRITVANGGALSAVAA